jgi:chromosome segregation ATPase
MILKEITIRNWRGYREPHTFRFCKKFNLVVGSNEAGKSTLFEALVHGLFERHNSKTREIKSIQPLDSSLSPEVSVIFEIDNKSFRLEKRFLKSEYSRLSSARDGNWEIDHEGDESDKQIRNLLNGESSNRTVKPEHRGLAEALWFLQKEDPLPKKTWNTAVQQSLSGIIDAAVHNPDEQVLFNAVSDEFSKFYTATKRIKTNSVLDRAIEQVKTGELRLSELSEKQSSVNQLRVELEGFEQSRQAKKSELDNAHEELDDLTKKLKDADSFESELDKLRTSMEEAKERTEGVTADLKTYESSVNELRDFKRQLGEAEAESAKTQSAAKNSEEEADMQRASWETTLQPELKKIEGSGLILRALERLRVLEKDKIRLQSHRDRALIIEDELRQAQIELNALNSPNSTEWQDYEKSIAEWTDARARAEASAILVRFNMDDPNTKITSEPLIELPADAEEYPVTAPTVFKLPNVGTVSVRGGGESLTVLRRRFQQLDDEIKAVRHKYAVKSHEEFALRREQHQGLERKVSELSSRLIDLTADNPDAETEIAKVSTGIQEETNNSRNMPKEWKKWNGTQIREESKRLEKEKQHLISEIAVSQNAEQTARKAHIDYLAKSQTASNQSAALKAKISNVEQLNSVILENYGTLKNLHSEASKATKESSYLQLQVNEQEDQFEQIVRTPRKLSETQNDRIEGINTELVDLNLLITDRQARIEQAAVQGLYSEIGDQEAKLQHDRSRLDVLETRGEAAILLKNMVEAHQRVKSEALSGPIVKTLSRWLGMLTEGNYDKLVFGEELLPSAVKTNRYNDPLPVDDLSFGTREQIIVLLRLAIGVLVSKEERNLVVIDDRLVNADALRMSRLRLILEEASTNSCQVIVATCNSSPYSGMPGEVINVPDDGRISAVV